MDLAGEIIRWASIVIWLVLILKARKTLKMNRQTGRELDAALLAAQQAKLKHDRAGELSVREIVDVTGLSPLQVQVAMDAAMAQFSQRISELQRSARGK